MTDRPSGRSWPSGPARRTIVSERQQSSRSQRLREESSVLRKERHLGRNHRKHCSPRARRHHLLRARLRGKIALQAKAANKSGSRHPGIQATTTAIGQFKPRMIAGLTRQSPTSTGRLAQAKNWPPLADIVDPVMKPASSPARKTAMRAISSGSPRRPTGICGIIRSFSTFSGTASTISVPI